MAAAKRMNDTESQASVFALLAHPATHGGNAVSRIDTHAAVVFLAGTRAFKVKRAVRFPFLNYSTLPKRKDACEAELRVNRAFAPEIYRRVVPITRESDGRLELDGGGSPVEWAIEMCRFDENATLDRLAEAGKIDAGGRGRALDRGARRLYRAERRCVPGDVPSLSARGDGGTHGASRGSHARIRDLLLERGRLGLIRHLHGDLHLGNIVLLGGRPVLFDAIEFDPLVAVGEVLYDLAFLLMDLVERELESCANVVFNRYLLETKRVEDLDALAGLPLFLSMRAAIRAKVTAARAEHATPDRKAALERSACTYFDFACRFIAPSRPVLVAVGGLSGTGKSALARALAPQLGPAPGAVVLRSDVERKTLFGKDEHDKLPSDAYSPEVTARVYTTIADKARRTVAAGHSAIVDAVFAKPQERALVEMSAAILGVPFHGLFLDAELDTRIARVGARSRDASDAAAAVARIQENYDFSALAWPRVDASGTLEQTLTRAQSALDQQSC